MFVAGFRNGDAMPDYASYAGYYNYIINGQFSYFIEMSFVLIAKISNTILYNESIILFVIYAIIGVTLKAHAIRKISPLFFYSLVIYISNYFILHEMIQIRVGVASAFILLSLVPLHDRSVKYFLLLIGFASFFHYTSIIFLSLWLLKSNKFNSIVYVSLIPLAYFLALFVDVASIFNFISYFLPTNGIAEKVAGYSQGVQERFKINVFGIFPLTRIIVLLFFIFFVHKIQQYNKYFYILLKMYALGVFVYIGCSSFPHLAVRIGYTLLVSEIFIIPALIYTIKGYYLPRLIVIFYGLLAFSFNVFFTTFFRWGGV